MIVADNRDFVPKYSSLKIAPTKLVALLEPDERFFCIRQLDKLNKSKGFETHRYIFLQIRDLIWLHNYLVQDIKREKKEKARGRMTSAGTIEKKNRTDRNPKLFRNENLQPAKYKRFEGKVVKKLEL